MLPLKNFISVIYNCIQDNLNKHNFFIFVKRLLSNYFTVIYFLIIKIDIMQNLNFFNLINNSFNLLLITSLMLIS